MAQQDANNKAGSDDLKQVFQGLPDFQGLPAGSLEKLGELMAVSEKMNPMLKKFIQSRLDKYGINLQTGKVAENGAGVSLNPSTSLKMTATSVESLTGSAAAPVAEKLQGGSTAGVGFRGTLSQSSAPQGMIPSRTTASMNAYFTAHGIKTVQSNTARNFLFILGLLVVTGWLFWHFGGTEFQSSVIDFLRSLD